MLEGQPHGDAPGQYAHASTMHTMLGGRGGDDQWNCNMLHDGVLYKYNMLMSQMLFLLHAIFSAYWRTSIAFLSRQC